LTVHEFAHGWAAWKCGDDTARRMGRLTLNPLPHLDPIGTLMLFASYFKDFIPFGWAKPVPIDSRNFNNPKRDIMLVSLAGPLSNIIVAFAGIAISIAFRFSSKGNFEMLIAHMIILPLIKLNVGLAIFNLLPFAPLDGSKVIIGILPNDKIAGYLYYSRYAGLTFLFLLIAESVLKIKTISYVLNPLFSFFQFKITHLFFLFSGLQ
jgi:Zn-dependent protease